MKINSSNQRWLYCHLSSEKHPIAQFLEIDDLIRSHPKLNLENSEYLILKVSGKVCLARRMTGFLDLESSRFKVIDLEAQEVEELDFGSDFQLENVFDPSKLEEREVFVLYHDAQNENEVAYFTKLLKRKFINAFI